MHIPRSLSYQEESIGENTELNYPNENTKPYLNDTPSTLTRRGLIYQAFIALAVNFTSIGLGLVFGYSAVALPQLQHEESWLIITKDESSWIASIVGLSLSLGCLISGAMMECWGRRTTVQIQCIPSTLGWILISSARGVSQLYVGRFMSGLGGGMVDAANLVYLSEVTSPSIRGAITCSNQLSFTFGVLLAYILGSFQLAWTTLAAVSSSFPIIGFLSLCFVPESPVWLVNHGRHTEAEKSLSRLRGYEKESTISFQELPPRQEVISTKKLLCSLFSKMTARPFCILLAFFFFQQFSGMNAVVFYAVNMFQGVGNAPETSGWLDPHQSAVLVGLTRCVMTAATCLMLAHFGRRPLAIISGTGMSVAMLALGTAFYFREEKGAESDPIVILPCLMLFIACNTMGFFAVPWVMLGELLPEKCRGVASGLVSAIAYSFVFVVVKTYPLLLDVVGEAGVFWVYGIIALTGTVFVLALLPETHNKSLEEIELSLRKS